MTKLESTIKKECIECIKAWKLENNGNILNIHYDDYTNYCYNYGGSNLKSIIDEFCNGYSDEELQDFYNSINYACECENRGIRTAIGQNIKHHRLLNEMSQQKLADKAGITKANLCNIEAGKYSVGIDVLNKITNALNIQIELLKL